MTGNRKVAPIDINGTIVPNRLQSWRLWRDLFRGDFPEYKDIPARFRQNGYTFPGDQYRFLSAARAVYKTSNCPFCGSSGIRMETEDSMIYCLCYLLELRAELMREYNNYFSIADKVSVDSLRVDIGSEKGHYDSLKQYKANLTTYLENPAFHLVLSGPTGVGKTHGLMAIASEWYPWIGYLTAADFENALRSALGDKEHPNRISDLMRGWMTWPGLAMDDLGAGQYLTDWIMAKLEMLIDARWNRAVWPDRITIVSTNLRSRDIKAHFVRDGASRIGSRLLDNERVRWIGINAMDFREVKV